MDLEQQFFTAVIAGFLVVFIVVGGGVVALNLYGSPVHACEHNVNDQDPVDADPVDPTPPEPEPDLDNGR